MQEIMRIVSFVSHYALPLLSLAVVVFSFWPLFNRKNSFSCFLLLEDSTRVDLTLKETLIGSSVDCDIRLAGLSKEHAVITLKNNSVLIRPLKNKTVLVNNNEITCETALNQYDVVSAGKREFSVRRKSIETKKKKKDKSDILSFTSLFAFEILVLLQFLFNYGMLSFALFGTYMLFECLYFAVAKATDKKIETVMFFLVSLGFTVVAGMGNGVFVKQFISFAIGCVAAFLLYFLISSKFAGALKLPAVIAAVALFAANILIGSIYNGSQNWIEINSVSFQPSEFIKVILVFLSAASADKIDKKYNTVGFTLFVGMCVAILAYLRDFGTAAVYIVVYLAVIMLRRCDIRFFLCVIGGGVALMGIAALAFPYVAKRIFSFGQAWENVFGTGYQQTRTMIAAASGGLLGVGTGNGYLRKITAFDTDIVFGLICEELGIIVAICAVVCFVLLALYSTRLLNYSASFYAIPACAAAIVFLAQTALNVFGSLDMLPFTGVTLPFISNGGSSVVTCVVLIAFFKAAERQAGKIK